MKYFPFNHDDDDLGLNYTDKVDIDGLQNLLIALEENSLNLS